MNTVTFFSACLMLLATGQVLAAPGWIIAAPSTTAAGGERLRLEAVRPGEKAPWPDALRLKLAIGAKSEIIVLLPDDAAAPGVESRRIYGAVLPQLSGHFTIEMADAPSNTLLLLAAPAEQPHAAPVAVAPESAVRMDDS